MAVILQELVLGDCSGVAFSRCTGREELAGDAGILVVQRNRKLLELAEMLR